MAQTKTRKPRSKSRKNKAAVQAIILAATAVTSVPLSALGASPDNPRVTDTSADEVLINSIRAHGILQNLGVIAHPIETGRYLVVYGRRRLDALQRLQDSGEIDAGYMVPVKIETGSEIDTFDAQISENVCRQAMNPVDEYEAFARLINMGRSVEQVAAQYATDIRSVKTRLALGKAAPCIREALRSNDITLGVAKVFASCPDTARQEAVYDDLSGHYAMSEYSVRSALFEATLSTDDNTVKFIGIDAYLEAGGEVQQSLIEDAGYLTDIELVSKLRDEKIQRFVDGIAEEGWAWVETTSEAEWQINRTHKRFTGAVVPKTDEQTARIEELDAIITLQQAYAEGDEDMPQGFEPLEEALVIEMMDELDRLRQQDYAYTDAQKAERGVFVWFRNGQLRASYGWSVRPPEKTPARDEAADATDATPDEKPVYSTSLNQDLAMYYVRGVQADIAQNPQEAAILLQYSMCKALFGSGYWENPTECTFRQSNIKVRNEDIDDTPAGEALTKAYGDFGDRSAADLSNLDYAEFRDLDDETRAKLTALAVAMSLKPSMGEAAVTIQTAAEAIGHNPRSYFTPNGPNLFARIRKDSIIEIIDELVGQDLRCQLLPKANPTKVDVVTTVERLFSGAQKVPDAAREKLDAFLPDTFDAKWRLSPNA